MPHLQNGRTRVSGRPAAREARAQHRLAPQLGDGQLPRLRAAQLEESAGRAPTAAAAAATRLVQEEQLQACGTAALTARSSVYLRKALSWSSIVTPALDANLA